MGLSRLKEWGCEVDTALERFLDDEELYIACLQSFTSEVSFAELGEKLAEKDYEESLNLAHTLKGVAGNLGLTPLYDVSSSLVQCFRDKQYEEVEQLYNQLMLDYEQYQIIIKEIEQEI